MGYNEPQLLNFTPERRMSLPSPAAGLTPYLPILAGAALWGTLGVIAQRLYAAGMTPLEVVSLRAGLAFLGLGLFMVLFRRRELRVARRDLPFFALYGLVSIGLFYFFYFQAIRLTGVTMAVVLLYTAPAFVVILSFYLFQEPLTRVRIVSLLATFAGSFLVVRAYDLESLRLNAIGIVTGLLAGLTYGLYSIFGKRALGRYPSTTTVFYAFLFGSLFLSLLGRPWQSLAAGYDGGTWLWVIFLALVPTLLAYALYTSGLRSVPSGTASIMATIEPVTAALLAFFFLHEPLGPVQVLGVGLVVAGVAAAQLNGSGKRAPQRMDSSSAS